MNGGRERFKHEGARVLLVEGRDDCHVIMALCDAHRIPETFGLYDCESDVKVLSRLNALILQPDPMEIIGVVMDADADIEGRWQSILSKIDKYRYHLPENPNSGGTIIEAATQMARDLAIDQIELDVWDFNAHAQRFFAAQGFFPPRTNWC